MITNAPKPKTITFLRPILSRPSVHFDTLPMQFTKHDEDILFTYVPVGDTLPVPPSSIKLSPVQSNVTTMPSVNGAAMWSSSSSSSTSSSSFSDLNQFNQLNVSTSRPFIPSMRFDGERVGYVFKKGKEGFGYYAEDYQEQPSSYPLSTLSLSTSSTTRVPNPLIPPGFERNVVGANRSISTASGSVAGRSISPGRSKSPGRGGFVGDFRTGNAIPAAAAGGIGSGSGGGSNFDNDTFSSARVFSVSHRVPGPMGLQMMPITMSCDSEGTSGVMPSVMIACLITVNDYVVQLWFSLSITISFCCLLSSPIHSFNHSFHSLVSIAPILDCICSFANLSSLQGSTKISSIQPGDVMVNLNGGPPLLAQGSNGDGHVISVATMLSKTRPATLKLFRCAKISSGVFDLVFACVFNSRQMK